MLKDRQQSILGAVIQEYIRTARPVASQELVRRFRLDVSPATVRNELLELDERGYLEQPHTSAGRVPTDKGYRYFVDYLMPDCELDSREEVMLRGAFREDEPEEFARFLGRVISEMSGAFTATGIGDGDIFYKSGFSEILEEPEFQEGEAIRSFGHLVDELDEHIIKLLENIATDGDGFFIGSENPLRDARPYTMTLARWKHPHGFEGFCSMITPRRTNYPQKKAIIKKIRIHE